MSRGISRQQAEIMAALERELGSRRWDYDRERKTYRRKSVREYWAEQGWGAPTFDPWVTPIQVLRRMPADEEPTARRRPMPVTPSRLRSVQRAMVSLARRRLLHKKGPRYRLRRPRSSV